MIKKKTDYRLIMQEKSTKNGKIGQVYAWVRNNWLFQT